MYVLYPDFEIELGETDNARALYERLLERTTHVKVWISYALFETTVGVQTGTEEAIAAAYETAREVFQRGYKFLKSADRKEEVSIALWGGFCIDLSRLCV